ncbi:MAG: hypothetical protein ACRELA_06155 [Candidatus Rokuibacteriota bacterium]
MIWRLTVGVAFLLLAAEEFFRAGPAAAELVRRPGDLVDALLSGDGSVGPWLLAAYGIVMLVRGWAHRPPRA